MYVNNAWELIGTSATDLTNYYTKSEVDGKLLLKANASDLTSHTGDTTIHVTASDKTKWNTVALIKQLRLVNAQVGSATTIAFSDIDDTNGIKVGDKCMDLDAKMFEITAVDTTNQTVTVGSALIDLALDGNVVHTSGNETISGTKFFTTTPQIYNSDSTVNEPNLTFKNSKYAIGDTTNTGEQKAIFVDKNNVWVGYIAFNKSISGIQNLTFKVYNKDSNDTGMASSINYSITKAGTVSFSPNENDVINLGSSTKIWKSVYATNYYYGANNVEFSTKFVTADTSQTITGVKTFSNDIVLQGTTTPVIKTISNIVLDSSSGNESIYWTVRDKTDTNTVVEQSFHKFSANSVEWRLGTTSVLGGVTITRGFRFANDPTNGEYVLKSSGNNTVLLGTSNNKWKDVNTNLINGLTPSSLSLPVINRTKYVDISGYFTNTGNGDTNTYPVTANGWIYFRLSDISSCQVQILDSGDNLLYGQSITGGIEQILIPVSNDVKLKTQWSTATSVNVVNARFIPCQGNI